MTEYTFVVKEDKEERITSEVAVFSDVLQRAEQTREHSGVPNGWLTIHARCPIELAEGDSLQTFDLGQKFLVRFEREYGAGDEYNSHRALDIMTLGQIIQMVEGINKASWPQDVHYDDFWWEDIPSAENYLGSYTAWPIPEGWQHPNWFPTVGVFMTDYLLDKEEESND